MGRSMACGGVSLLVCFAVLVTLASGESPYTQYLRIKFEEQYYKSRAAPRTTTVPPTSTVPPRPLYQKDGFLAGEETPVWFASYTRGRGCTYKRIKPQGSPIVKRSWNYWGTLKRRSGFPVRKIRSTAYRGNLTYTEQFQDSMNNAKMDHFDSPSLIEKRSADSNEVVYPSVLVVMDYHDVFPTEDKKQSWSVEHLVLYALAFWGTVDSSLRNIQNPRVSLRIAGIVITTSRDASVYLRWNLGEKTFVRTLSPMLNHWRSASKNKLIDLPIGSYDIVAHMTDVYPWSNFIEWTALYRQNNPILGTASEGPPCKLTDQIGGLIIHDELAFNGIHKAIAQMSKVLGGSDKVERVYGFPRRWWSQEIVDSVSNALKNTTCMSAPKQHHRTGAPIPAILAGELMPNGKQCELADYRPDAWTCWDTSVTNRRSNCHFLSCSNQHVWGVTCSEVSLTLDGSFCNAENTKICLDGQCVDKI